jgi:hypothetical protein
MPGVRAPPQQGWFVLEMVKMGCFADQTVVLAVAG